MKGYQIIIIIVIFFALGYFLSEKALAQNRDLLSNFLGNGNADNNSVPNSSVGTFDLWCENGKYYKRTVTEIYGQPTMQELTRNEFDVLVAQGNSYSGCKVDNNGNITA